VITVKRNSSLSNVGSVNPREIMRDCTCVVHAFLPSACIITVQQDSIQNTVLCIRSARLHSPWGVTVNNKKLQSVTTQSRRLFPIHADVNCAGPGPIRNSYRYSAAAHTGVLFYVSLLLLQSISNCAVQAHSHAASSSRTYAAADFMPLPFMPSIECTLVDNE